MKLTFWLSAAALAASLVAGSTQIAAAQSDRTMGINCTVAGHVHCGENGPIWGSHRWYHRGYRRHWRHHLARY